MGSPSRRPTPRRAVLHIPAYRPGRRPADLVAGADQHTLARLASNESPFGPLPSVLRAIETQLGDINRYPDAGATALRAAIARQLGLPAAYVTVGAGSSGLLWQIAQVFLDERSEVVVPWPSFEAYPIITQLMGAELTTVALRDSTADVPALIGAITERTKLVVLAEPNNPTGTAAGHAAVIELVRATSERCVLVLDEAYLEFRPGFDRAADARRIAALVREHPHVIVVRTFSKAYGLAGLRVGYAAAAPAMISLIDRVAPPFAVSSIGQVAASASLDAVDELDDRVAIVRAERARVIAALRALGLRIPTTVTNFVWIPASELARLAPGSTVDPGVDPAVEVAAALEREAVITRAVRGLGLRVTMGESASNDRFLRALSRLATGAGAGTRG